MRRCGPWFATVLLLSFVGAGAATGHQALAADAGQRSLLGQLYEQRLSGRQVEGSGKVIRILRDDKEGSRHQRFIIRLVSGQTLLVAHNIDLAPRIDSLRTGDTVYFNGEYRWNRQGGLVHWTHHDPRGHHPGGWLKHRGKTYR